LKQKENRLPLGGFKKTAIFAVRKLKIKLQAGELSKVHHLKIKKI
jgi:hypothetical protein